MFFIEYMEKHSVSRLIGAPPGYVGYDEGGQLSEAVRRKPYAVVLFDEVEKAHPDVFNVLLQVLDDGRITDAQGHTVEFKNTVIIMTSNIGSRHLLDGVTGDTIPENGRESVMTELRRGFRPEFLNRIDETILCKPLTLEEIAQIVDLLLVDLNKRLAVWNAIAVALTAWKAALMNKRSWLLAITSLIGVVGAIATASAAPDGAPLRKVRDFVIYEDPLYYAAFPSVVRRADGELIVAFRRAPSREALGESGSSHVDPNSYLVQVRSRDGGATWTREPGLIYAHAFGGSQDPCLLQLRDGTLLCATYGWAFLQPQAVKKLKPPVFENRSGVVFLGGFLVRSDDGGRSWQGPFYPPHIAPEINHDIHGRPLPAYNRGALCEGRSGRLFWVVAANDTEKPRKTSNHLLISDDKGVTWRYSAPVAVDAKVTFNEASVYETARGDLVAFLRTANFDDHACLARSLDGGRTFQPWEDLGFKGHPLHATRLPDGRVLLVYGYRHQPYGVRARLLNADCTNARDVPEFVIRDDGGTTDLGYPWSVALEGRRVLVVYYFNRAGGVRHIAGSILEIDG